MTVHIFRGTIGKINYNYLLYNYNIMSNPILIGPIIGQIDLRFSTAIILSTFSSTGKYIYELVPDNTIYPTIKVKTNVLQIKMPVQTVIQNLSLNKTNYTINLLANDLSLLGPGIGRLRISSKHKIAFTSGNNYKLSENTNMWTGILEDTDVDLVVMMGNNVYADGVFYKVLNELTIQTNDNINEIVDDAFYAYHDLYYDTWVNNPILQQVMSTTSIIMMPENHDVFSLWGTGKMPAGYDKDIFLAALKIAKTVVNKYQRNLMLAKSFPSDSNYYFKHVWGNIALFCNEFRNGTSVELDYKQRHEMIGFAKRAKLHGIQSFVCVSPTFLFPTNDRLVHFDNVSSLVDIFVKSTSKAAMTNDNAAFYFNAVFEIKKLYSNVTVVCGNSNIFIEGTVIQNETKCVPFYSASPIMMMPINLLYPASNTDSSTEGIAFEKQIGSFYNNLYTFRGDYNNVRNYVTGYYDSDSTNVIIEKVLNAPTNISDMNVSSFTEFIMDVANINVGSLSDPVGTSDRITYIRSQKSLIDVLSSFVQTLFT